MIGSGHEYNQYANDAVWHRETPGVLWGRRHAIVFVQMASNCVARVQPSPLGA